MQMKSENNYFGNFLVYYVKLTSLSAVVEEVLVCCDAGVVAHSGRT